MATQQHANVTNRLFVGHWGRSAEVRHSATLWHPVRSQVFSYHLSPLLAQHHLSSYHSIPHQLDAQNSLWSELQRRKGPFALPHHSQPYNLNRAAHVLQARDFLLQVWLQCNLIHILPYFTGHSLQYLKNILTDCPTALATAGADNRATYTQTLSKLTSASLTQLCGTVQLNAAAKQILNTNILLFHI